MNASRHFLKGNPKTALTTAAMDAMARALLEWSDRPKLWRVVSSEAVRAADCNLNPSRLVYVFPQSHPFGIRQADRISAAARRIQALA